MNNKERADLYKMFRALAERLNEIAKDTDDFDTADKLEELASVVDDSADHLVFNRD